MRLSRSVVARNSSEKITKSNKRACASYTMYNLDKYNHYVLVCTAINWITLAMGNSTYAMESVRLEPLPARRVKAGKAVTFTCSLYEGDNVSFFWSKNGVILKTGDRIDISATRYSATLSIRGVKPSDAGDYLCVGRNAVSEEKATAKLQVEGAYLTKARKDFSIICVLFKG
ncbi:immunoglobulin superfamily member 10-like [Varroa destructor]|uniref:Ig-like domain-containing protein n=1 Tax=Varroa destructor TaxID=109461 RepID=A0A7M7JK79_VARDE|nr:immunoglobulin superfamily member 10-like [Varroa destructor]